MGGTKVWSTEGCWVAPASDYPWRHSTAPPWTPWSPPHPTSLMKLTLVFTNQLCTLITWPLFTSADWLAKTMLTKGLCSQNDSEERRPWKKSLPTLSYWWRNYIPTPQQCCVKFHQVKFVCMDPSEGNDNSDVNTASWCSNSLQGSISSWIISVY